MEEYDFRKCHCGYSERPNLYGSGIAKQYIKHKGDKQNIVFSEFDGYVVECGECFATTKYYSTPEAAVDAWNRKELSYLGDIDYDIC